MAKDKSKQEQLVEKRVDAAPKHVLAEEFGSEYAHAVTSKKFYGPDDKVRENLKKFETEKE